MANISINIPSMEMVHYNQMDSWENFLKRFQIAIIGKGFADAALPTEEEEKKKEIEHRKGAALLEAIGEEGFEIFQSFDIKVEEILYDSLVEKFTNYFGERENKTILRHRFLEGRQEEEEEVEVFIQRIEKMGAHCKLGELKEEMVMHVVVKGLLEDSLRNELLKEKDLSLTLLKATTARAVAANKTAEELKKRKFKRVEIELTQKKNEESFRRNKLPTCYTCKKEGHFSRNCPDNKDKECYSCGEKGHIAPHCESKKKERECYSCGEKGHIAPQCQNSQRGRGGYRGRGSRGRGGYRREESERKEENQARYVGEHQKRDESL